MNDVTRILIVEDKPTDYELAQREIRKSLQGCAFKRVETHEQYVAVLESWKPHIILSDYSLPNFNGMSALKLAQQYAPLSPVIIWTGSISEDVAVECMKAGASNYVLKEDLKRLGPAVVRGLEESQLLFEHRQAESRYQSIFENSPIGVFQSTPEGKFISVNPAMARIYGYHSPEEMIEAVTDIGVQTYVTPEERDVFMQQLESQGVVQDFEGKIVRKDGSIFWTSTSARVVRDASGNTLYYEGFLQVINDRKIADERIAQNERRFRALIENGMDNISLLAADGTLLWENPAVNHTLGYGSNAFVDRNIFELMHPEDLGWTSALFRELIQEPGSQRRGTFRLMRNDGAWRWIEATATNLLHEPGVNAVVINYRDITERKLAEEESKDNQSNYRNLVETSHDLIWSVDAEGRFTFVNGAAREIYGYEPEELIGRFYFDIMDPEYGQLTPEAFKAAIAEIFAPITGEVYVRHKDGRQLILSANSIVLRDATGKVVGVTGSSRDITEKKRAEEALNEERNLLRTLIDHLPDRVYAMDKQGRKTLSNTADWKASGGKKMEDVLGKTDFEMYPPELAEPFWQVDKAVLESGQAIINFEEPGLDFDGNPVSILTSKIPLQDEAGNVIGLVGIGRDITERKQAEEAMRESERRYRTLFEDMPIAIWEEDFSAVKARLDTLKAQGITDLRTHLTAHPEEIWNCNQLIRIQDVNHAAVEMYRARSKEQLIRETLQELSRGEEENAVEHLISIAEGKSSYGWEGGDETCDGRPLEIRLSWSVVPGHEKDYSKVIVSTIDITERKMMEQAEREQRTLAEALRDTGQILNSTLDYGEVLDHILEAVERVVPHNAGTIMLIEGNDACVVRSHGYEQRGFKDEVHGVRLPLAATNNLRKILETKRPLIVYDTHTEPGWKRLAVTDWLRANVGAPISIQGEVIGFILLDSDTPGFFTPVHAERLEAFANQAALAIHNARLLHQAKEEIAERKRTEMELQQKNEDLRLLNVVNNAIVRGQNLDSIVDLLTIELKRIFSAVGSTLYMLSADKRFLTMQQYSFSPETERRIEKLLGFKIPRIEIPIKEGGHFHNTLVTKQSAITTDPQKIQEWIAEFAETTALPPVARAAVRNLIPHIFKLLNIKSTIIVPLISQEDVIGFLDVSGSAPFTRVDLKRIETIAEQLTSVIQRQQANERIHKSEEFLKGIQNSLSAHIAILDEHGTIVQVNEAWRRFGDQNGLRSPDYCVGTNYFAICESAKGTDSEVAQETLSAIRQVLTGDRSEASIEYSCHAPDDQGWFTLNITCFNDGKQKWVILAHEDITERKIAELSAMESMTQFRTLFEASPDAIILIDPNNEWRIVDCNSATCKMNGYTREELIGQPIDILNTERDTPEKHTQYMDRIRAHDVLRYEAKHVHKDGTILDIDVSTTLIQLGDRELVLGIDRDITARKSIEKELQQSESRYRTVVENQTEFIVRWKPDGTRSFVNDAYCRYFGVTQAEALHSDYLPLIHEDDRQVVEAKITRLLSGSSNLETDIHRVIRPDGSICWNEWTDQAIYDENGQLIEFQAVGRDITQNKIAEQELRDSEERFRQLADNIDEGFWITDAQTGQEIYLSPAVEKIWGIPAENFIDGTSTFMEFIVPEDLSKVEYGIERERAGEKWDMEYRIRRPDGSLRWVWDRAFPVLDEDGNVMKLTGISTDVTERKLAEEELYRRARETAALLETSLALTNLDLNAILHSIGHSAKSLFIADGCRIFLMQPDGQSLRCVLALQENAGSLSNLQVKIGDGVTGAVAASGRAEIVNEMHKDPRAGHIPGTPDQEQEAIMFAPIKGLDRILGVLSVRRSGTHQPFTSADLELLEAFASMAAAAVSNARLFQETERRLAELQALYENGLAVGRLLEAREIGEQIIQTFARYLSWHHVTIRLLRPETDELELIAYNMPSLGEEQRSLMERNFHTRIQKSGQGISGSVVQSGVPIRTGNVHTHPQYVDIHSGTQSGLYMPLKVADRIIGVISVESELPDAFTEQDERLLATLANQAAISFENARLYQAAQQEIAERRRAQEALWASETHYRQLADSITDILFELDQDLRYTHWNKASEMFSGVPAEDAIGRSMGDVWGSAQSQLQREEIYRAVLREREAKTFETELLVHGEKRALEIRAYPSTHGVSVVARDITERRVSETLLEKRFELIEYSAQHSLAEVMQKVIDEVSNLTGSRIGFMHLVEPDENTIDLQVWSTETFRESCQMEEGMKHHPVGQAGVWADALRERRSVIHNDYAAILKKQGLPDGHSELIREMVIPIIRGEKVVAIMGVGNKEQDYTQRDVELIQRFADYAWDVTERKQMETALADERNQLAQRVEERTADLSRANSNLARALRVKDEFLANMSHELRTPLNAILGLSESLSEQVAGPLNEKQQKYLSTINESGHHLLSLINDILDLAKIEAGQITLDINKVDVNSVCQASLRMIKQLAQRKNQNVNFTIDSNLGLMWADERRLKQMMVNLLSNAVKFTPESGELGLEVHGDSAANRITISVWDRGIGISERDLGRLFQPFVQLDAGLAREASGTGLGLALVAQMARLHGGSVSVESHHRQGSRFTILLPWEPAMAGDASTRLRSTGKFRAIKPDEVRPTILLIEDTQEVVMMLVDYLEMAGFRMVTAQDGIDGLTQAKLAHPDLILMDIQMPRMDGFETTKRLRTDPEFKETPIIALTALAMPNDRQRCLDAGMNEYLSKPVNLKALAKTIKTFLYEAEAASS